MEFNREFFLDEERDGFLVPGMMKKAWASSVRNYEKLLNICRKHDIKIFASWGTLIAAIRHGGFIPWDDDLDLMIFREDLEKLKGVLKDEPDLGDFHLQDYHVTMGDNMVRQWLEKSIYIYDPDEWEKRHGFPLGDVVDIFVIDHIPKDIEKRYHQAEVIGACNKLQLLARDIYGDSAKRNKAKESSEFKSALKEVESLIGKPVRFDGKTPIRVQIVEVMDDHIASYAHGYADEGVADIANYLGNKDRLLPKEYFSDYIDVPYETGTIPVPIGYDSILKRYYGEYMTPQIAVDYGHDYPFYERYTKILKDQFGFELLRYRFDEKTYKENINKKERGTPIDQDIKNTLELAKEAHGFILKVLENKSGTENILEILGNCQGLLINLGTKAEIRLKDPKELISGIEKYCELIYKLYESLIQGTGDVDLVSAAKEGFFEIEKLLEKLNISEDDEKKEVLFLCDRASHWEALYPIYKEYLKRDDTHVSVMALPYKYKDATWIVPEGDWERDISGYPDDIFLTEPLEYNIELIHPDTIIYTFPYDSYSDVIAPHPELYLERLRCFTDEMVFVTPYKLREIEDGDKRSRYTLNCFIANPGAVYADRIYVQSEQMKKVYIELLSEMTESIDWEKKIVCKECSRVEKDEKDIVASNKKKILIYFSASMIYDHEGAIDKMAGVVEMLESKTDDIQPVWVKDPYAEQILKKHRPREWTRYEELLSGIENKDVWIVDDGVDCDRLARECAAMYGDAGVLMNKCRMYGKPVMWENPDIDI